MTDAAADAKRVLLDNAVKTLAGAVAARDAAAADLETKRLALAGTKTDSAAFTDAGVLVAKSEASYNAAFSAWQTAARNVELATAAFDVAAKAAP